MTKSQKDQSAFLAEGIWENGYEDKFIDEVKSMKVGDKIAIKASKTQKLDLPFDSGGKTVSVMLIKATGTIVKISMMENRLKLNGILPWQNQKTGIFIPADQLYGA